MPIRPFTRVKATKKRVHTCDPTPEVLTIPDEDECESLEASFEEFKRQNSDIESDSDDDQEVFEDESNNISDEPLSADSFDHTYKEDFLPPRETHPFSTLVALVGGNKKKKPYKGNKYKKRTGVRRNNQNGIPRNLRGNDIMPPSKRVTVNFLDPIMPIAAPTSSFVCRSFRINDLYDPDANPLTTTYAGFIDLMNFYEFFRVDKVDVIWAPANNETFQVVVGFTFSQTNLNSVILTRQDAIDALENGITTRSFTLQQRNGGRSDVNIKRQIMCKSLLGDPPLYEGDVSYTGTATSSPADQLWINLFVISPQNTVLLLNGTVGTFEMRAHALLFGRKTLNDTLIAEARLNHCTDEQLENAWKKRMIAKMEKDKDKDK